MALKDQIELGMSIPHRSTQPIPTSAVRSVVQRAEILGFRDLWVTSNTLDHAGCMDSLTLLSYAAAITERIGLGVSVMVLPIHNPYEVAHRVSTLDRLSGGRAILGVGIGREPAYVEFQMSTEHRVARFREELDVIRALWTSDKANFTGRFYELHDAEMGPKPVQQPHPPIWFGGAHPSALQRAALLADGWMGAGASSTDSFATSVALLGEALERAGRDQSNFPISKRVFLAVDDDPSRARAELDHFYAGVYRRDSLTDEIGVWGRPAEVLGRLEELVSLGANHLLLNPISRFEDQLEIMAEAVGLA